MQSCPITCGYLVKCKMKGKPYKSWSLGPYKRS